MAIAGMPLQRWRSFRTFTDESHQENQRPELKFVSPGLAVETTPE
jgi:hypothetical protein